MWKSWSSLKHPLFPELKAAPAVGAKGRYTVLAGSLLELMSARLRGAVATRAVWVICQSGTPFLAEEEREILWELFGVPIFGLLVAETMEILASECEAQEGLHVHAPVIPGRRETVVSDLCHCGRPGQRLILAPSTISAARRGEPVAV